MGNGTLIILVAIGTIIVVGGITVALVQIGIKNYRKAQTLEAEGVVQKATEKPRPLKLKHAIKL